MKVLLVSSFTLPDDPPLFPLGLACLAGTLAGHEVRAFDFNTHPSPFEELERAARSFEPDVVGLSVRNMFFARPGKVVSPLEVHTAVVRRIRALCTRASFIVGGCGFSLYAENLMRRWAEVDLGVFGEGEITFRSLIENASAFRREPGVLYREDGQVRYTGDRDWIDFDALPSPRWDLLDLAPYRRHPTSIGIQTRRGCELRCLHCSDLRLLGPCVRTRSPEKVADDVETLVRRHRVESFAFADQVFNVPREHGEAICHELRRRRLPARWSAWLNEKEVSASFLRLCKEAGCEMAHFSPDSAHDATLRTLRKNITARDIYKACRAAKAVNMPLSLNFMINGPGDTLWGIAKTCLAITGAKLYLRGLLKLHGNAINRMRIYPHTELRKLAVREGTISVDDELLEPTYYEPGALARFGRLVVGLEAIAWRLVGRLRGRDRASRKLPEGGH